MWSKARDLSTSRRVIHSFCGQTTPRWHIRVIWNRLHLASSRKHPAAESGRIRANLSATFARAHLAERRIPRAHERPSRLRSSLPVSRSRQTLTRTHPPVITTGVPHQRKNTRRLHCVAFPAGLTMKCEPSHRMVWYSTDHENRHFPTIPEAPQYPPRPHQPQNRIKSRGVVQPAANCRPPPPSPPQHGAEIAAIRDSAKNIVSKAKAR